MDESRIARHADLIARLEAEFAGRGNGHEHEADASHDIGHARRVMRTVLDIAAAEGGADDGVIIAAAYLHDWVNLPKTHPGRARSSQLSSEAAEPILIRLGFSAQRIEAVRHAILTHSFSANLPPRTLEARSLQDADRLEALGAIGIARTFCVAGHLGTALFDAADPFAVGRELDDRRFAVDHFALKLLRLPSTMQTETGRAMAQARVETMRAFLASLARELGHDMPW